MLRLYCIDIINVTAIVWDYTDEKVQILTNYHTWDCEEFKNIFPPKQQDTLKKKAKISKNTKNKNDNEENDSIILTLSNSDFRMEFILISDVFLVWDINEDYAVIQLPKNGFCMSRIPIALSLRLTQRVHAFGYIGHTGEFNITPGEVCSIIPRGFTMSLLSAPGYSGAAILSDGLGRAIGYMGGNLDASAIKNSQHQAYAFRFDEVAIATRRQESPSSSPSGKVVDINSRRETLSSSSI